jgi:hypothetical protein
MSTSPDKTTQHVAITNIYFNQQTLALVLNDGRELLLHLDQITWLNWLAEAALEQRANWSLEPDGYAVCWEDLDDGIEVEHVLSFQPLVSH